MQRPLLIVTISYLIGIIIGVYFKASIPFIVFIVICILICIKIKKFEKVEKNILIIIVITIFASSTKTIYLNNKYNTLYKNFNQKEITIIGTIYSNVEKTDYKDVAIIKIDSIRMNNKNITGKYRNTQLIVNIKKNADTKIKYGNKLIITGIYEEPSTSRNYKGFNYKENLKTKNIYGNIRVENSDNIKIIKDKNINFILLQINKFTEKIKQNLSGLLSKEMYELEKGILLGDSSNIDKNIKENFKNCNLSHMLAVSGTHLAYLVLGTNLILNTKFLGKRNIKIINIIVIYVFMIITNMSPSVVRAGISAIISIFGNLIYRKQDTYTTISIALLLTLINNPFSLFNIGLQLSYLATLGIVIFYPKIKKYSISKNKIKKYIIDSIILTISANILILPLVIYNFNILPTNFILANLLASPILGICVILGLFLSIISFISIKFAKLVSFILEIFLNILLQITKIVSKIPNKIVITPYFITIVICYILIGFIMIILKNKEKVVKSKNSIKILSLILIGIVLISNLINFDNELRLYFIDVGQGDSTLICTPTGKNILIDGGGNQYLESYDVGENVLLPYLLDRRIKKLDYIILSHFDADHVRTDYLL